MIHYVPRLMRDSLAKMYPKEDQSRVVVEDAQLDPLAIQFSSESRLNWRNILHEAYLKNKIESVLYVAAREYGDSPLYHLARLSFIVNNIKVDTKIALSIYNQQRTWLRPTKMQVESLDDMLEDLWEPPLKVVDRNPLIEFIERVACAVEVSRFADELRSWVDIAAPIIQKGITDQDIRAKRLQTINEKQTKTDVKCYLTVEITPDFGDPSRPGPKLYSIETLLWREGQQDEYWNNETISGVQIQAVAEIVEDLIETQLDDSTRNSLTIEFLLPDSLFVQEVDQWPRKYGKYTDVPGVVLGMDYPVVIRSLRRLKKPSSWRHWRNKWQYIQEHQQEFTIEHVFWLHGYGEHDPLRLRSILAEETIVPCVGMTFTFANSLTDHDSILATMIETGIPVSFWLRPCPHNSEESEKVKEKIRHICAKVCLDDLPKHLHKVRRRSKGDESQDLGNHLTLLWDDPTRIPVKHTAKYNESQRFQEPQNRH